MGEPWQALVDRQEIHDVLMRYARGIDRLDMDLVRSCYHPGATDDHGPFKGSVEDFIPWVHEALKAFDSTMHLLANELIELDGTVANTETYCVAHHVLDTGSKAWIVGVRYVDRFERREGVWAIANRTVVYEWSRHTDGMSDDLPPGAVAAQRDQSDHVFRNAFDSQ